MVPSMTLIFFASSTDELALVRLTTDPVVPLPILLWEVFSDCAFVIPTVVPIIMTDDSIRIHRKFFIIKRMALNYLMVQPTDSSLQNQHINRYILCGSTNEWLLINSTKCCNGCKKQSLEQKLEPFSSKKSYIQHCVSNQQRVTRIPNNPFFKDRLIRSRNKF